MLPNQTASIYLISADYRFMYFIDFNIVKNSVTYLKYNMAIEYGQYLCIDLLNNLIMDR